MLNHLIKLDHSLFLFINHLPHNFFLDSFFKLLSGVGYLGAIWIVIGILLFICKELFDKKGFYALLLAGLSVLIFVEIILKRFFKRLRPEFTIKNANVLESMLKSFSFPSGHTTMSFAAAFILSKMHKKFTLGYFTLAILISFSRIYLGRHYPLDVIVGSLLGLVIGYVCSKAVGV